MSIVLLVVGRNRFIAPSASPKGAMRRGLAERRNKAIAPYERCDPLHLRGVGNDRRRRLRRHAGRRRRPLDKVSFGTNWVAEAEHGGLYQALADGTYKQYGLDVTIVPGGPNVNNRILLPVGKLDFFMSANTLQTSTRSSRTFPTLAVAAMFQKDPQVLIAHPDQASTSSRTSRGSRCSSPRRGIASYFQWLKADFGFSEARVKPYTFNPQPFLADKNSAMQGYVTSEPYAVEKQGGFQAQGVPARRPGLQRLFDPDRDPPRSRREEARPGAALRRCLDHRLVPTTSTATTSAATR